MATSAKVIERLDAHYEVREVPIGKVHRWCSEKVLVECDCRETSREGS